MYFFMKKLIKKETVKCINHVFYIIIENQELFNYNRYSIKQSLIKEDSKIFKLKENQLRDKKIDSQQGIIYQNSLN